MSCERYKACHNASFLSWPGGLAVNICDNRAAGRLRRRFKSGCTPIYLDLFSADPQRLFLLLYILVSVPTLCTQGNCLGWGPSDRTGLAGTEYHRTLNCVV